MRAAPLRAIRAVDQRTVAVVACVPRVDRQWRLCVEAKRCNRERVDNADVAAQLLVSDATATAPLQPNRKAEAVSSNKEVYDHVDALY